MDIAVVKPRRFIRTSLKKLGKSGFFITFKVLVKSADEAIALLRSSNEMKDLMGSKIEEVEEKGISIRHLFANQPEILHQTGRAYFNLDPV